MAQLSAQSKSIQALYRWYAEGKIKVNRRYQRKLVWTLEEKQKLIESVTSRYPIPAILLVDKGEGVVEVIDGLQRLHSLMSFIDNDFATIDDRHFNVSEFPTAAKRRSELELLRGNFDIAEERLWSSAEVSQFLDYDLAVTTVSESTDEEIDDIFRRINTYGKRLSDQERRQAGVKDLFSDTVRRLSYDFRGDVGGDSIDLAKMPEISIDLPKSNHGYEIKASDIFWVKHGILQSTDLRDSEDEQYLADLLACCLRGDKLIKREKSELDKVYEQGSDLNISLNNALHSKGADNIMDEIRYCIDQLDSVTDIKKGITLKSILFPGANNNKIAAVYNTILIGLYELLIIDQKQIDDFDQLRSNITNIKGHIHTGRGATTLEARRKNVDVIKGLMSSCVIPREGEPIGEITSARKVENLIREYRIESSRLEFKQGICNLDNNRNINRNVFIKVIESICGIANSGKEGLIIIGVADSGDDVLTVEELDKISSHQVGKYHVVGIDRECHVLNETIDQYVARWRDEINNSRLSKPLKLDVLASLQYHEFHGLGVLLIHVPVQQDVSYIGDDVYHRVANSTKRATSKEVHSITKRFFNKS